MPDNIWHIFMLFLAICGTSSFAKTKSGVKPNCNHQSWLLNDAEFDKCTKKLSDMCAKDPKCMPKQLGSGSISSAPPAHEPEQPSTLKSEIQEEIPSGFSVQNLNLVHPMPPAHSAESASISLCYAFTAAGLIDQLQCRMNKANCDTTEDGVSILDLSLVSNAGAFTDVGSTLDDTLRMTSGTQMAKESCMPFATNPLFQSSNVNRIDLWQKILGMQDSTPGPALEIRSASLASQWPVKIETSKVMTAMKEDDPHKFIGKLLEDPICRSNGISLSSFKLVTFHAESEKLEDYDAMKAKLKSYFANGIPVGWSFCLKKWGSDCSEGHVVIIHGSRELCHSTETSSKKCEDQFLVRDSANIISSAGPGDIWVTDAGFSQRSADSVELSRNNSNFPQFSIIEP